MANTEAEKLLNEIGENLAENMEYKSRETLLYAEVGDNWASPSIFINHGNHIRYQRVGSEDLKVLCDPLMWLWDKSEPGKQWVEIEYLIRDGHFTVTYTYPDEIDPEEDPLVRRDRIVARHFGDKPIVYPPWEDNGIQQFEL